MIGRHRTQQTGWLINGQPVTLREGRKVYGLRPAGGRPTLRRDRLRSWWHWKRSRWAGRIAP